MTRAKEPKATGKNDRDNGEFCDEIYGKVVDLYGDETPAWKIPIHHRTVLLAWLADGIIGNGGFQYLFEGSFAGDSEYRLTVAAFRSIGCEPAVKAFDHALSVFPQENFPKVSERIKHYIGLPDEVKAFHDRMFWHAKDELNDKLAKYIHTHWAEFCNL